MLAFLQALLVHSSAFLEDRRVLLVGPGALPQQRVAPTRPDADRSETDAKGEKLSQADLHELAELAQRLGARRTYVLYQASQAPSAAQALADARIEWVDAADFSVRQGAFDFAMVAHLDGFLEPHKVIAQVRTALAESGAAAFQTRANSERLPYEAHYESVSMQFEHVSMLGQAQFHAIAVTTLGSEDPSITIEQQLAGDPMPAQLIASLAGPPEVLDPRYTLVEVDAPSLPPVPEPRLVESVEAVNVTASGARLSNVSSADLVQTQSAPLPDEISLQAERAQRKQAEERARRLSEHVAQFEVEQADYKKEIAALKQVADEELNRSDRIELQRTREVTVLQSALISARSELKRREQELERLMSDVELHIEEGAKDDAERDEREAALKAQLGVMDKAIEQAAERARQPLERLLDSADKRANEAVKRLNEAQAQRAEALQALTLLEQDQGKAAAQEAEARVAEVSALETKLRELTQAHLELQGVAAARLAAGQELVYRASLEEAREAKLDKLAFKLATAEAALIANQWKIQELSVTAPELKRATGAAQSQPSAKEDPHSRS
jgi:hypothetical protein